MPQAAPRWCSFCRSVHPYWCACPQRAAERRAEVDRNRPGPRQRGYDRHWQHARAEFLAEHPRCFQCGGIASEVHHERAHRGSREVFWDRAGWRPACRACHSAITLDELRQRSRA